MRLAVGTDFGGELWQSALAALERKYSKPVFEMWLKPMRPLGLTDGELTLSVQSPFARDWAENRLKPELTDVLSSLLGHALSLRFIVVQEGEPVRTDALPQPPRASFPDELRHGNLNPRYTFDEFVIGNSNRFAHAASLAVAEAPAKAYNRSSLRRRRVGQDPFNARDRASRHRREPALECRVRVQREVHERIHHRDQEQPDGRVPQQVPPRRRPAHRRHPVSRGQGADARGIFPYF